MKLIIQQDELPESPDSWGDDGCFLIAGHRNFYVPPPGKKRGHWTVTEALADYQDTYHVFPLEAYIHSGVVLALAGEGNFPDRHWDVSLVGAVLVSKKESRLRKSARKAAECLIETWNQYLSGDVWAIAIENDEGQVVDSCGGFYGRKCAEAEGMALLRHCEEHGFCPVI